jgi:hypothetical protein
MCCVPGRSAVASNIRVIAAERMCWAQSTDAIDAGSVAAAAALT